MKRKYRQRIALFLFEILKHTFINSSCCYRKILRLGFDGLQKAIRTLISRIQFEHHVIYKRHGGIPAAVAYDSFSQYEKVTHLCIVKQASIRNGHTTFVSAKLLSCTAENDIIIQLDTF